VIDPRPQHVQMLIRVAILSIIPFSATVALVGAGPVWALGIFFLVVPAIFLSARFRVT
jgi:4-hydroxybenzoate polyprenyltransferase